MIKFCECGSILRESNCTNRKCKNHKKEQERATYHQVKYLEVLYARTGQDQPNLWELSKKEASELIKALELCD